VCELAKKGRDDSLMDFFGMAHCM